MASPSLLLSYEQIHTKDIELLLIFFINLFDLKKIYVASDKTFYYNSSNLIVNSSATIP